MAVTLYGASWCGPCTQTKAFFKKYNIDYTYVDTDSPEGQIEFSKLGVRSIPVIMINGKQIIGFNEAAIKEALK